ncbi:DUF2867 domain-containing protein [Tenacibaculum sp. SSH1-16]|uniref:DUF2867 domain-containing protein n=1 Tax=Tenacibaculum sp. SSH1-16 TaxID=3136667 RepID=UPI0032C49E05
MKKVKEDKTLLNKDIKKLLPTINFHDTFSTTNHTNTIEEIVNLIFNKPPVWVDFLFKLRNKIAAFFNLKNNYPDDYNERFDVGGYVSFFKIFSISSNEVVLGANDTHLNFRAIVHNNHDPFYNINVITLVEYNNKKGEVYMKLIKPFHRLVVKRMVKNAYKLNN